MSSEQKLPDYDPHRLEKQIAVAREMHRRGWYTDEKLQRVIDRFRDEDREQCRKFIDAGYRKFDIPKLEQELYETMTRRERRQLGKTRRWLYGWNLDPPENPLEVIGYWNLEDPEKERTKSRRQAQARVASQHDFVTDPLDWLWPQRLPLGKVSLLTGDSSEGKSLIACDLIARVTAGRDWPDGSGNPEPGEVLLIAPEAGLNDVVFPRLEAARADLSRLHVLSSVDWKDRKTGEPDSDSFRLPVDGPILESTLQQHQPLRLVVIDPLSAFVSLPAAPAERDGALHDILADLEALADIHQFSLLCVETGRRGGLIKAAAGRQWRAHYDPVFQTVWGAARDPRDRGRRLILPVRHHLGDDRTGLQFAIAAVESGAARIAWGEPDDSITFAEATGRVRLGRSIWSFSQTADAEAWLRKYLKDGEKPSVQIFSDARELGFTEFPLRSALRRVATKIKQGKKGSWHWRLKEKG